MSKAKIIELVVAAAVGWWVWHELDNVVAKGTQNVKKAEDPNGGSAWDKLVSSDAG